jgi:hypothetical protein
MEQEPNKAVPANQWRVEPVREIHIPNEHKPASTVTIKLGKGIGRRAVLETQPDTEDDSDTSEGA